MSLSVSLSEVRQHQPLSAIWCHQCQYHAPNNSSNEHMLYNLSNLLFSLLTWRRQTIAVALRIGKRFLGNTFFAIAASYSSNILSISSRSGLESAIHTRNLFSLPFLLFLTSLPFSLLSVPFFPISFLFSPKYSGDTCHDIWFPRFEVAYCWREEVKNFTPFEASRSSSTTWPMEQTNQKLSKCVKRSKVVRKGAR